MAGCSRLFYHPERDPVPLPPGASLPAFEDLSFRASDGTSLHGRFFPAEPPARGTLVQFHGNGQNLTAHALFLSWAVGRGHNLFVFDYRGYGRSEGEPDPGGVLLDGLAALPLALALHRERAPAGAPFVVVGQSLGGAVAMRALEDWPGRDAVDLLVLDSAFASYRRVAFTKLAGSPLTWALSPLAWVLVSDRAAGDPGRIVRPLLVVHSERDPVVPFALGERIHREAGSAEKEFWRIKEPGHTLAFATRGRRERFLARVAAAARSARPEP